MEGVSNTRLLLVVEVKNIAGPLAINIPPPPTDRLWYESVNFSYLVVYMCLCWIYDDD